MAATNQSNPKRITKPRRLLILTPSDDSNETIPVLLHSLTGVPVTPQVVSSTPTVLDTKSASTEATTGKDTETATDTNEKPSFAGYTTHAPFQITNKYYSAEVPIWVDEIPVSSSSSGKQGQEEEAETTEWKSLFLSEEAREVRDAIGAILLCVRNPKSLISRAVPKEALSDHKADDGSGKEDMKEPTERGDVQTIKDFVQIACELKAKIEAERNGDEDNEGEDDLAGQMQGTAEVPGLLVLLDEHRSSSSSPQKKKEYTTIDGSDDDDELGVSEPFTSPWWEDVLYDMGIFGFEIIPWAPSTAATTPASTTTTLTEPQEIRNIYGELEGLPRIKEVLSTHEWADSSSASAFAYGDEDDDDIMAFLNSDRDTRGEESNGFRFEVNQLEREMMDLKFAINENNDLEGENAAAANVGVEEGEEVEVENLEALMMRMRAIKGLSTSLVFFLPLCGSDDYWPRCHTSCRFR